MTSFRLLRRADFYLTLIVACAPVSVAAATAGKVLYAIGEAYAVDSAGKKHGLTRGAVVSEGETLTTGRGRMQVRFRDGAYVALQPQSQFAIESYQFDGAAPDLGRSLFNLVKGGIRAITGLIGRTNRSNYRVRTKVATIGIRGTTYKARYCEGDCIEPDGLYASGGEGVIVLTNDAGELELSRGQRGYVATPTSFPLLTVAEPEVSDIPAPSEMAEDIVGVASKLEFSGGETVFQGSVTGVSSIIPLEQAAAALSGSVIFEGELESGVTIVAGARNVDDGIDSLVGLFNGFGGLIGIAGVDEDGVAGAAVATNVIDISTDGILFLGRWTSGIGTAFADDGFSESVTLDANDNVHYIVGTQPVIMPGAGTATYRFGGLATSSTGFDGSLGDGITGGRIDVNFGTRAVSTAFTASHGGALSVSTFGFINSRTDFFFDGGVFSFIETIDEPAFDTNGFATGGACMPSCPAEADGFFSGSGSVPPRIGLSYKIDVPGGGIVGVGGFNLE